MFKQSDTTAYFGELKKQESKNRMANDLKKLLQQYSEDDKSKYTEAFQGFLELFQKYLDQREKIEWNEIKPVPTDHFLNSSKFKPFQRTDIRKLLSKLVVIKLNGGLGTTMRCSGPKSLIPVRNDLSFLDLTVQQIDNLNKEYDANVPLVLMNSFSTSKSTEEVLKKYQRLSIKIFTFLQNKYPRISADNFEPLPHTFNDLDDSAWYPPGHGNFFEAFFKSGLLQKFLDDGREICFVSNIDNLGATVDFPILNWLLDTDASSKPSFLMEVTEKTPADVKGGTLVYHKDKIRLLEYAEVPSEHLDEFKGARKFKIFNTNNLWIKLKPMYCLTAENKISLGLIENRKRLKTEAGTTEVIQLETPIGAAIQSFPGAMGVIVPRSRFLPVKTTSDLFLLKSNLYVVENGNIIMNPKRPFPSVPIVRLADDHFGDYRELDKRFVKMPDCLDLHQLTISGDVVIGKDVSFKGNVTIIANHNERIDIPQGSLFEGKIVTGCLRVVDY